VREDRVIRLASNESPHGPSPQAVAAYHEAASRLHRYPDGGAVSLREALGRRHGLDPARIVCGNGSDDLIALLARAYAGPGDEVIHSEYGFLVYPIAVRSAGARPVAAPEPEFRTDVDNVLACVSPRTRLVFLANPNNPTGSYLAVSELRRLRAGLPDDVLLVIDSAYAEYVGAPDYDSGSDLVAEFDNVVMTRTFSKIYGLAALRLGWAYCPPAVADVLDRVRGPFNVTGPTLAAGEAALASTDHVTAARRHNDVWLPQLTAKIAGLGLTVFPSVANFVLVRFPTDPGRNADAANAFLQERGIIARAMGAYKLPDCLRISVGLDDEMTAVIAALAEFMG
jgi:histidinol-phosphate aminotransferase